MSMYDNRQQVGLDCTKPVVVPVLHMHYTILQCVSIVTHLLYTYGIIYKHANKALARIYQGGLDPFSQTPYGLFVTESAVLESVTAVRYYIPLQCIYRSRTSTRLHYTIGTVRSTTTGRQTNVFVLLTITTRQSTVSRICMLYIFLIDIL